LFGISGLPPKWLINFCFGYQFDPTMASAAGL